MKEFALAALLSFNGVVLTYFVFLNSAYLLTSLLAFRALRRYERQLRTIDVEDLLATGGAPPITVIAPAYNEEATCVEAVRALLTLRYPEYEILVVNDGSRDGTLERLRETFELEPCERAATASVPSAPVRGVYRSRRQPNLWVVDKVNGGGKADALNAGINRCRTPLLCAIDVDTLLEPDALVRVVRPFLEDGSTIAAGGIIRVLNGCEVKAGVVQTVRLPRNLLARFQILEYLRAFLSGRMGWAAIDALLIISGAFGLFRRSAVVEAGGFDTATVGEDMELVVRLHRRFREARKPYRITFVPDPVAWTEAPETMGVLAGQRDRWQRGLMQTMRKHPGLLFNPRYGRIGLLATPYYYLLEAFGPVIEAVGYVTFILAIVLGVASDIYIVGFLAVAFVYGVALSLAAVAMEEMTFRRYQARGDLVRLFALAVLENFGYRQINTFWRMRGVFSWLRRRKGWGTMVRRGFTPAQVQQ